MKAILRAIALCGMIGVAIAIAPRAFAQEGAVHNADRATGTTAAGVAHETARAGESAAAEREATAPLLPSNATEAKEYFMAPAVWTLVIFLIMLAILYPTAWKNVLAGLKKREERIRKDIADAEAARTHAEATLRQYNDQLAQAENRVREMLSKATADGEKPATNIRMQAQQEAEQIKDRANKDIEAARDAAIRDIYAQAANLSTSIAEKIIRRNLNAADQETLVRESLDQLQTVR